MTSPAPASTPALTVYFDGACPVCRREIGLYRRQPGADACAWVDAAACDARALGPDLDRPAALARLHVRDGSGRLLRGARAFAALWAALPRTAWLGRIAGWGPMPALLDLAYAAFLRLRPLWRPAEAPAAPTWPRAIEADLRSDHAGETGAVAIYRGVLAVTRDPALRRFASAHLATEQGHLEVIESHLPAAHRSRLLPAWRVAGWLTGALPALAGSRAVYATVAAVETFVDQHYAAQVARLDALLAAPEDPSSASAWKALRDDLEHCRLDEVHHREDALRAGPSQGLWTRVWASMVGRGSAAAVALARRI